MLILKNYLVRPLSDNLTSFAVNHGQKNQLTKLDIPESRWSSFPVDVSISGHVFFPDYRFWKKFLHSPEWSHSNVSCWTWLTRTMTQDWQWIMFIVENFRVKKWVWQEYLSKSYPTEKMKERFKPRKNISSLERVPSEILPGKRHITFRFWLYLFHRKN